MLRIAAGNVCHASGPATLKPARAIFFSDDKVQVVGMMSASAAHLERTTLVVISGTEAPCRADCYEQSGKART